MNLHKATNYKPVEVKNPFLEGQDRAYADILLDKMNEMRWWRGIIGAGILVLFAISLIMFGYALCLNSTLDKLFGIKQRVGIALYGG